MSKFYLFFALCIVVPLLWQLHRSLNPPPILGITEFSPVTIVDENWFIKDRWRFGICVENTWNAHTWKEISSDFMSPWWEEGKTKIEKLESGNIQTGRVNHFMYITKASSDWILLSWKYRAARDSEALALDHVQMRVKAIVYYCAEYARQSWLDRCGEAFLKTFGLVISAGMGAYFGSRKAHMKNIHEAVPILTGLTLFYGWFVVFMWDARNSSQ